jgi:Cu/Ag efflux protein CusF
VKIFFSIAFVILLMISLPLAGAASQSLTTGSGTAEKTEKVKGKVKKIDMAKHKIKVKVDEKETVYTFGSTTKFVKDEKPVQPSMLKIGDKVVISKDSKNFAHKVKIESHSGDAK